MTRLLNHTTLAIAVTLTLVTTAIAMLLTAPRTDKVITAYFAEAPALYRGDSVRVLGVEIGEIDSITAEPDRVRVVLHHDPEIRIPADATAVIVSPTLVSSRFVQLAPAYTAGPALPDDATIPQSRTATPVEWDTTVTQLTRLATELGPASGEVTGALGRALDTVQANVNGQGDQIHQTIRNASAAMTTLAEGGEDLFGTVHNLQSVVTNLALNDTAVTAFSKQLTDVSALLAGNRARLATAISTLDQVAPLVRDFIRDNRDQLATSLGGLTGVAGQIAAHRQALADFLQRAPVAVSNLNNDYDPVGSLQPGAFALTNFSDPATFTCSLIFAAGGRNDNTNAACEAVIAPFVQVLKMNNVPLLTNPVQTSGGGR